MRFSLVIPCFNEAQNLPALVERCMGVVAGAGAEVILVDNGSTDGSWRILEALVANRPGLRAVHVETNRGYGFGIRAGLDRAVGDVLAWTHADMQTDPHDVLEGLPFFPSDGSDMLVKGRRRGRRAGDAVFSIGMSVFETVLFGRRLWDINAQPTLLTRGMYERWDNPPDDFGLDLYAYAQARRLQVVVCRFPVSFGKRLHGTSHWNVNLASKWKFIRRTVRYSIDLRFGTNP